MKDKEEIGEVEVKREPLHRKEVEEENRTPKEDAKSQLRKKDSS